MLSGRLAGHPGGDDGQSRNYLRGQGKRLYWFHEGKVATPIGPHGVKGGQILAAFNKRTTREIADALRPHDVQGARTRLAAWLAEVVAVARDEDAIRVHKNYRLLRQDTATGNVDTLRSSSEQLLQTLARQSDALATVIRDAI